MNETTKKDMERAVFSENQRIKDAESDLIKLLQEIKPFIKKHKTKPLVSTEGKWFDSRSCF